MRISSYVSRVLVLAALGVACAAGHAVTVAETEDLEATGFADSRKVVRNQATGRLFAGYRTKFKQDKATNYRVYIKYSDDDGATWSLCNSGNPVDTQGSYKQRVPSLAISTDSARTLHITWYGLHAGKQENEREIKYSRSTDSCATFSATTQVTNVPGYVGTMPWWQEHPVLQTYSNWVFLAWESRDGASANGAISIIRSSDYGATWSAPTFVQRDTSYAYSRPTISVYGPASHPTVLLGAHAFTTTNATRFIYWTQSTDAGATWPNAWERLCASCTADHRHVSFSAADSGTHAVWRDISAAGYSQIKYAVFNGASWSTPIAVSDESTHQFTPHIEVDRNHSDKIWVIWTASTDSFGLPSEKPLSGHLYYATKFPAASSFSAKVSVPTNGYAIYPTLRRIAGLAAGKMDVFYTDAEPIVVNTKTIYRAVHTGLTRSSGRSNAPHPLQ